MNTLSRRVLLLSLALLPLVIHGCGGSSSSPSVNTASVQKGSVVQGPVEGATVFADNVRAGNRFVQDPGEISAATTSTGSFFLPTFPTYDFILVSTGGTDTITRQPALLLLAPAGSPNITPLTTLVTLDTTNGTMDPTKGVRKKLEALNGGRSFDTNVATNSTQATLLLIKSAETAVQSMTDAVKQAAADASTTVDQAQINYIQAQTWQQIALEFERTSQNLATPTGLYIALNSAITNAIAAIKAEPKNSNISSFDSFISAGAIANNSVNAALDSLFVAGTVNRTSTTPLDTLAIKAESTLLNPTTVFKNAVLATVSVLKTAFSITVIGVTPNPYTPTPLPVITVTNAAIISILTGSSGGTGGTGIFF
jgi:hypothetical protein